MKKLLYLVFVILLIGILLISSIFLYKEFAEKNKQEKLFEEIAETVIVEQQNTEENKEESIDIQKLYEQNNDTVGWVKIEDTNIDYPVMQTKDRPNYYLRKNFYKEYSISGTPYISEQCDIENSDNLIVYGHNIKGNKMFADLEKYKKESFYKEHKTIKFYTINEFAEYEIIAVFKTNTDTGFKYYKYCNLKDEKEFETFINKCIELSLYKTNVKAEYGDKFITLSTCEYSQNNGRLVVVARKIL